MGRAKGSSASLAAVFSAVSGAGTSGVQFVQLPGEDAPRRMFVVGDDAAVPVPTLPGSNVYPFAIPANEWRRYDKVLGALARGEGLTAAEQAALLTQADRDGAGGKTKKVSEHDARHWLVEACHVAHWPYEIANNTYSTPTNAQAAANCGAQSRKTAATLRETAAFMRAGLDAWTADHSELPPCCELYGTHDGHRRLMDETRTHLMRCADDVFAEDLAAHLNDKGYTSADFRSGGTGVALNVDAARYIVQHLRIGGTTVRQTSKGYELTRDRAVCAAYVEQHEQSAEAADERATQQEEAARLWFPRDEADRALRERMCQSPTVREHSETYKRAQAVVPEKKAAGAERKRDRAAARGTTPQEMAATRWRDLQTDPSVLGALAHIKAGHAKRLKATVAPELYAQAVEAYHAQRYVDSQALPTPEIQVKLGFAWFPSVINGYKAASRAWKA